MTRVEATPPAAPQPKRSFQLPIPRFSLGRLIKLALLIGVLWVLVQIARTGVWTIPLISKFAYTAPEPIRLVQAATPSTGALLARVPDALVKKSVSITEMELSAIAEQGNQKLHLGLASVQTVITSQSIELSFLMPKRNNAIVRLELEPIVSASGDPDFRVVRSRLGQLDVPQWIVGEPARRLLQLQLQPAFSLLPELQNVQTAEGTLAYTIAAL